MDSLTHVVLGAVTGELIAGKKLGKKAMLWGALANSLPDIDVVCAAFMNIPDELLAHRGFTHSFLFAALAAALLAWPAERLNRKSGVGFKGWSLFLFVELLLHCLVDTLTTYGTGLLEPFTHQRYSLNVVFVADPFFTLPLLISFIVLLVIKTGSAKRKGWSLAGILLCAFYLLFAFYNKTMVNRVLLQNISERKIIPQDYFSTPTPFNNFLWYAVIRQDSGFSISHYSIFDKSTSLVFYYVPQNDSLRRDIAQDADVKKLIRFSQGYYSLQKDHDTLVFNDLRFGQVGGWFMPDAPFVFRYKLAEMADNDVVIQRGRARASSSAALRQLITRIFRDKK